eukprot:NODE_53_length_26956_cov_0.387348.p5 type:complete len:486 gc:universal NODE_53_length_26956_cov_0.387348:18784-20241(+)
MFVLIETAAGYALLDADKEATKASQVSLQAFHPFSTTQSALQAMLHSVDNSVDPNLQSFLKKHVKDVVMVDKHLAPQLKKIKVVHMETQIRRFIQKHLGALLKDNNVKEMQLGLAHAMARYKLKFSADKLDTMIIQAVALLDDLDKQVNTYAMRVKEWYGWHFPELAKIVVDNSAYSKFVLLCGVRTNIDQVHEQLSKILPLEIEDQVLKAAQMSMGTEINENDVKAIRHLATQVVELTDYRNQLHRYLCTRMQAIAPNLTAIVGELVGARLISHAGSLLSLAKQPASTIQLLGAEKALFRALKTKKATPKYGLLFHASLVGTAQAKNKGKIARLVATKCALGARLDALCDESVDLGDDFRNTIENRLNVLEGRPVTKIVKTQSKVFEVEGVVQPKSVKPISVKPISVKPTSEEVPESEIVQTTPMDVDEEQEKPKKKKSKKSKKSSTVEEIEEPSKKRKAEEQDNGQEEEKKKKKKKRKSKADE